MLSSLYWFGGSFLTVLLVFFVLAYGKRSGREQLCRAIALVMIVFCVAGGRRLVTIAGFGDTQANTSAEAQQDSDDIFGKSAELVNCAAISLMPGMLLAVLIVFHRGNNTVYKKARLSLSQPVAKGRMLDDVPQVRRVYVRLSGELNGREFIR